jgi:hypothetical protein
MNKQYILLTMILAISLASAFYVGETIVVENPLNNANLTWTIVDNISELVILPEVSYNATNIIVHFPSNMPPNAFMIVFLNDQTKEVVKEIIIEKHSGGSSPITRIINQTKFVEVPNYITEYVDRVINQTINYSDAANGSIPLMPKKNNGWFWVAIIGGVIVGVCIFFYILRKLKGGQEQYE